MTRVSVPTSHRAPRAARKASGQSKTSRWTTREHEVYLQAVWGSTRLTRQQAAELVGTRSRQQLISHNQKMEERVLEAVAGGQLSEKYDSAGLCLPSIDGIVNRMTNDGRFRVKMLNAIRDDSCRTSDDEHIARLLQAIEERFRVCAMPQELVPSFPLGLFALEGTTSSSTSARADELLQMEEEDEASIITVATDDSGSTQSTHSPASSYGDEDSIYVQGDQSEFWDADYVLKLLTGC